MSQPLVSLRISADYPNKPGVLRDVALDIGDGEILGLVGRSGSGKSTVTLALLGLLAWKGGRLRGEIMFAGRDLAAAREREWRRVRGRDIALVLQSPLSALNPAMTIGAQMREAWRAHAPRDRAAERARFLELLASVNLPAEEAFLARRPSQLSVGQAQRVLIAMAILHRPKLLVADEPTSALDPITQAEVLALFGSLNRELGMSILFISHDLVSVAGLCHRVAILEEGELVECASAWQIFHAPRHPYTRRLVAALPRIPLAGHAEPPMAGLHGLVHAHETAASDPAVKISPCVPVSTPAGCPFVKSQNP